MSRRNHNNNSARIADLRAQQAHIRPTTPQKKYAVTITHSPLPTSKPKALSIATTPQVLIPSILHTYHHMPSRTLPNKMILTVLVAFILAHAGRTALASQAPMGECSKINSDLIKSSSQRLDAIMIVDPTIPHDKKAAVTTGCRELKKTLLKCLEERPETRYSILLSIFQTHFKIKCGLGEASSNAMHYSLNGLFNTANETLFFPTNQFSATHDRIANIKHEFRHALCNYLHMQCIANNGAKTTSDSRKYSRLTPTYPINEKTIADYNKALEAGNKRIAEFKKLLVKAVRLNVIEFTHNQTPVRNKKTSSSWTAKDEKQLNIYLNAFPQEKITDYAWFTTTKEHYNILADQGAVVGKKTYLVDSTDGVPYTEIFEIRTVRHGSDTIYQCYGGTSNIGFLLMLPEYVKTALQADVYKKLTKDEKIIEQDAYTFQFLTQKLEETFYPEACQIHEGFKKTCGKKMLEDLLKPSCSP